MGNGFTPDLTISQRQELGRAARDKTPLESHAEWTPREDRRDPVAILAAQNQARLQWLVPIRHQRMGVSSFTFFRGAAAVMAEDLSGTPDSGLWVQDGGDAHLSNFGAYASPNRELVFDANDFDETLPGPWEWDLKRLTASLVIAAKHVGLKKKQAREIAAHAVRTYREAMAHYASLPVMELWYDYLDIDDIADLSGLSSKELRGRLESFVAKARTKTSLQALKKLATTESGKLRIRSQPPLLVPLDEIPTEYDPQTVRQVTQEAYDRYVDSTSDQIKFLLSRFHIVDMAIKVVGVGSVGTRCWIVLLEGRDNQDPLFLQIKEAVPSVLEDHLQPSQYQHQGQRVVQGQRLVQAQTDIFLGWTTGIEGRQYYVRQLRDWKGSANVERGTLEDLRFYARICAHTMARGHARSGDSVAIAAYTGETRTLDEALAEFSIRYAEQNDLDYAAFQQAVDTGVLPVSSLPPAE